MLFASRSCWAQQTLEVWQHRTALIHWCFVMNGRTQNHSMTISRGSGGWKWKLNSRDWYDDDSGETYFGINVCEEHDLSQLTLEVLDRDADRYMIAISATSAPTITGKPEAVTMKAWATCRANCSYPA